MDGGLLQLIATGAQDIFLTSKPEFTPFKKIYRKTSPFSLMDSEVLLPELVYEKTILSKIPKVGDLLNSVYLELNIPDFKIKKLNEEYLSKDILIDSTYELKKKILEKIIKLDSKQDLYLNDSTIINLASKGLGRLFLFSRELYYG